MKEKFLNMGTERKSFFITGLILVIISLANLVEGIISFVSGSSKDSYIGTVENAMKDSGLEGDPAMYAQIIAGVFLGVMAISFLLNIFLGYKAIKNSLNPTSEKAHLTVATILLVISAISLVSLLSNFVLWEFVGGLLTTGFMLLYVIEGKKVRSLA